MLDLLAFTYLIVLLLASASLLVVSFWTLSERWGRGKAAFVVAGVGLTVYIGIIVAVGFMGFVADKAMRHWGVQSTWIVTYEMQRLLATGPLLLFAGAGVGLAGVLTAFHRHRA